MNPDSIQVPAFVAGMLTIASLILIPAVTTAMSRLPLEVSAKSSESPEGAACNLPPELEINSEDKEIAADNMPSIDRKRTENIKTATFAMG